MLTLEQIIELQEKGFSYEQLQVLNAMNMGTPETPETPPSKLGGEIEKEEDETPSKPEKETKKKAAEDDNVLAKQIAELTATVKAIQAQNVKQAEQEKEKVLTSEDVIKSFMQAS